MRILSGMRPTGKLHIGHYVGALENWVKLQDDYQNFHLIADYHVLTTALRNDNIYENTIDMIIRNTQRIGNFIFVTGNFRTVILVKTTSGSYPHKPIMVFQNAQCRIVRKSFLHRKFPKS